MSSVVAETVGRIVECTRVLVASVLRETMFTDAESDGWGAEHTAEDAVVEFLPAFIDLGLRSPGRGPLLLALAVK